MPRFRLSATVGVSAYTIVDAETLTEAIKIANGRVAVLGGTGSGSDETEDWIIEDADGSPQDIHDADV